MAQQREILSHTLTLLKREYPEVLVWSSAAVAPKERNRLCETRRFDFVELGEIVMNLRRVPTQPSKRNLGKFRQRVALAQVVSNTLL